jgi:hypothetical protein
MFPDFHQDVEDVQRFALAILEYNEYLSSGARSLYNTRRQRLMNVMKATDPMTPESTRPVLLALALRLIQAQQLPSWASPDKMHLHVSVLLAMNPPAYQEAYDLLESEHGKRLQTINLNVAELRRTVWEKLGKWKDEIAWCRRRLETGLVLYSSSRTSLS